MGNENEGGSTREGGGTHEEGGIAPFDAVEGRLTVFALANGMDLTKVRGLRKLGWFRDGLERGILVSPDAGGGFEVRVRAWPFGHGGAEAEHRGAERTVAREVRADQLTGVLDAAIEHANGLSLT